MKIRIPATSANLGPGFDCLGLSLELFNEIEIQNAKEEKIIIQGEEQGNVKLLKNNIFVTIFNKTFSKLTQTEQKFHFHFYNNIPFSRGLGSSSAVIVGAIASAYKLAQISFDKDQILNLALEYENHPDNIAPATLGGFVCAMLNEKKVLYIKKEVDKDFKALISIPNIPFSTKNSRIALAKNVSLENAVFNLSHASFLTACFLEKKYDMLTLASQDKLHQIKRMEALPKLFELQKFALENGALMSTLSGSGSSFFTMVHKDEVKSISSKIRSNFEEFELKILEFDDKGYEFC